jgi:uncharacterized protein
MHSFTLYQKGIPFLIDLSMPEKPNGKLILFLHGFKSFKDWGPWPWLANNLAYTGFAVLKINFSHNGVGATNETKEEFVNLNLFQKNSLSTELSDIEIVLEFINQNKNTLFANLNTEDLIIMGHSRGGGMALVAANQFKNIKKVITLNAVGDFETLWSNYNKEEWQTNKVVYTYNGRTKQNMPLGYELLQDYNENKSKFNLKQIIANMPADWLLIHALNDETVSVENAYTYKALRSNVILNTIPNTGHTFGATYPFLEPSIALHSVLGSIIAYLNEADDYSVYDW